MASWWLQSTRPRAGRRPGRGAQFDVERLFGAAAATLAFIKKAIDPNNAGVDRCLPCLEFHISDQHWIAFCPWMDFPVPPRRRILLDVKINTTMLHDTLLRSLSIRSQNHPCGPWPVSGGAGDMPRPEARLPEVAPHAPDEFDNLKCNLALNLTDQLYCWAAPLRHAGTSVTFCPVIVSQIRISMLSPPSRDLLKVENISHSQMGRHFARGGG